MGTTWGCTARHWLRADQVLLSRKDKSNRGNRAASCKHTQRSAYCAVRDHKFINPAQPQVADGCSCQYSPAVRYHTSVYWGAPAPPPPPRLPACLAMSQVVLCKLLLLDRTTSAAVPTPNNSTPSRQSNTGRARHSGWTVEWSYCKRSLSITDELRSAVCDHLKQLRPLSMVLHTRHPCHCTVQCSQNSHFPVAYLRGGASCEGPYPFARTAVIFVTILGLFLAPFRDKIAATSDQMRFFGPENALKCVCGPGPRWESLQRSPALSTCLLLTHVALCQRVRGVIARTRYINVLTYLHQ